LKEDEMSDLDDDAPEVSHSPIRIEDMAEIAGAVVAKAKTGDLYAAELVSRMWRWQPRLELDLPPVREAADVATAQAHVVAKLSANRLTPRDALTVATILEYRRRAIESSNDDERLKELERLAAELASSRPPGKNTGKGGKG
jgi:predicted nucleic acid-binding protein